MIGANNSACPPPQLKIDSPHGLATHKPPPSPPSQPADLPQAPWPPRRLIATLPKLEFSLSRSEQKPSHFLIATKNSILHFAPHSSSSHPNPLPPPEFHPHPPRNLPDLLHSRPDTCNISASKSSSGVHFARPDGHVIAAHRAPIATRNISEPPQKMRCRRVLR